jgi:hypothetical protein
MGWTTRVRISLREMFFSASRRTVGPTQPRIQWVPGVKRQGREADHSPPTNAEFKNDGAYLHTLRDNFTYIFPIFMRTTCSSRLILRDLFAVNHFPPYLRSMHESSNFPSKFLRNKLDKLFVLVALKFFFVLWTIGTSILTSGSRGSTVILYLGGPEFISRTGDRLS